MSVESFDHEAGESRLVFGEPKTSILQLQLLYELRVHYNAKSQVVPHRAVESGLSKILYLLVVTLHIGDQSKSARMILQLTVVCYTEIVCKVKAHEVFNS